MSAKTTIPTELHEEGITIKGDNFTRVNEDGESLWGAMPLDRARVLLYTRESQAAFLPESLNLASTQVSYLRAILLGLAQDGFTGNVLVDTGRGQKKLFFEEGDLVFATSNQMDDRLGEVLYRNGIINLDELTDAAVQVTRLRKFGQVLMASGALTAADLWNGLKDQVKCILDSVFLVNKVFYQINENGKTPPTKVRFPEGCPDLIEGAASQGLRFRSFLKSFTPESEIWVLEKPDWHEQAKGTFEEDFLTLVRENKTVALLTENCKLSDIYTVHTLLQLITKGVCAANERVDTLSTFPESLATLKLAIESYEALINLAAQGFSSEGLTLPVEDLRRVLNESSHKDIVDCMWLDERGHFFGESIYAMYQVCRASDYMERKVHDIVITLHDFLLQLVSDFLPKEASTEIKKNFLQMVG